ncbi:phage tail assembly protein [Lacrimispora indolis]|uniref:phage tail assembly protein n=1 Tax=Lacrimispora indolis TaxID=69825 RepID=UPI00041A8694|nr:phage tail assembly protein [[Clostridium] methoxybenzovorans]
MEKDTKSTETKRDEMIGEDAIPVATSDEEATSSLLPKKEETDELVIKFRKPFSFEGEVHNELDLHGLEDLRGRDLTAIEKSFNKTGVSTVMPETTTTFAKIVATRVTGLPAEYFEDLPAGEVEKIKNAVVGFLYKDE